MIQVAAAAMKNGPWQGSNGVITEGASPNSQNDGVYFKCQSFPLLCSLARPY